MTTIPDTPPLDLENLVASDVEPSEEFGVPDHKASDRPKRNIAELFASKKVDAPPKPRANSTRAKKPTPRAKKGQFVEPLTELYVGIGTMLMAVDPVCANAIVVAAPQCAESLDQLAYQNDAVRRALVSLTQTSAVGVVMFAHMPIILAIVMHHVPAAKSMLGTMVTPPENSEAQTE